MNLRTKKRKENSVKQTISFEQYLASDDYKRQELEYGKNHNPQHFVDEEDGEIITVWVAF